MIGMLAVFVPVVNGHETWSSLPGHRSTATADTLTGTDCGRKGGGDARAMCGSFQGAHGHVHVSV